MRTLVSFRLLAVLALVALAGPSPVRAAAAVPQAEKEEVDLLSFAQGATFVAQSGLARGSASNALRMIDGDVQRITITNDAGGPVEVIYALPGNTVFTRFAIPDVRERPGNVTFVRSVTVTGSGDGRDGPFHTLADFDLEAHTGPGQVTEVVVVDAMPVRWIKIRLEGGIYIAPGDEGRTNLEFTELIGNGTQAEIPLATVFDGLWAFRLTERPDLGGKPLFLRQQGAILSGCLDTIVIRGTVSGTIARATGVDAFRNDRPSAFVFVADGDGAIQAVWSENNSIFGAYTPIEISDLSPPPCAEEPPVTGFCGTAAYVNFDFDSATIRPESAQLLAHLHAGLVVEGAAMVSVEGHTSTEGSAEHNLELSLRRAGAVMDELIARGFDAGRISASGKGELEPIRSPDPDEVSRSLNRRVEIVCS